MVDPIGDNVGDDREEAIEVAQFGQAEDQEGVGFESLRQVQPAFRFSGFNLVLVFRALTARPLDELPEALVGARLAE